MKQSKGTVAEVAEDLVGMQPHRLTVMSASWQVSVHAETGEPLAQAQVDEYFREERYTMVKASGRRVTGLAIGKNADDPLHFIRSDGTLEIYSIWNYNLYHYEGTAHFEFASA